MKTRIPIALMGLVFVFSTAACTLPGSVSKWTVMSWNVQNLFDAVDDGNEYDEFSPSRGGWDGRLYLRRLERTGEVITKTVPGGADLLILQELESPAVLEDLVKTGLKGQSYPWRLAIPGYSIIRCGILSRHPISEVRVVDCGIWGSRSLRPALFFTVHTPAGPVRVAALHWKSPRDGRAITEEARRREAVVVRDSLQEELGRDEAGGFLVVGDLNTPGDGAVLPAALAPLDFRGNGEDDQSIIFRTETPEDAGMRNGALVLYDPEPSRGAPGTYFFQGDWGRPDRALLSPGLLDSIGPQYETCYVPGSEVMGDSQGRPLRWNSSWEEGYSDHYPLVLEFRFSPP